MQEPLHRLLLSLFSAQELREFLALRLAEDLTVFLPENTTPSTLALAAVRCLSARDLVNDALFLALIDRSPRRAEEIRAVQRSLEQHRANVPTASSENQKQRPSGPSADAWLGRVIPTGAPVRPGRPRSRRQPGDSLEPGWLPPPRRKNPASLLNARRGVVPFHAWLRARD